MCTVGKMRGVCRTLGGEELDVPKIVSKNLIGEVEIMVGLEGQLRFL